MNGGTGSIIAAASSMYQATGSKKRKRGLAPKRKQPVQTENAAAATVAKAAPTGAVNESAALLRTGETVAVPAAAAQNNPEDCPSVANGRETVECSDYSEQQEGPTCSMCGKSAPHAMVDLSTNSEMRHTLANYWKMPANGIKSTLSSLCVQCVYKINAHKEVTRSLTIKLHRLVNNPVYNVNNHKAEPIVEESNKRTKKCVSKRNIVVKEDIKEEEEIGADADVNVHVTVETKTRQNSKRKTKREKHKRYQIQSVQQPTMFAEHEATVASQTDNNSCCLNSTAVLTPDSVRASDDAGEQQLCSPTPLPLPTVVNNKKQPVLNTDCLTSPPYSPPQSRPEILLVSDTETSPQTPPRVATPRCPLDLSINEQSRSIKRACVVQVEPINLEKEIPVQRTRPLKQALHVERKLSPVLPLASTTPPPVVADVTILNFPSRSSSHSSGGAYPSMLEVVSERTEYALATESGGNINNYKRVQNLPQQLVCQYCSRVYWRKFFYAKHLRSCSSRHWHRVRSKSMASARNSRSLVTERELDAAAIETTAREPRLKSTVKKDAMTTLPYKRVFHCSQCAVTVETMGKLREHKRIHLQHFYCDNCSAEFTAYYAYDFHRAVCVATEEALKQPTDRRGIAASNVRMTRSRSRAASCAASIATSMAPSRAASMATPMAPSHAVSTYTSVSKTRPYKRRRAPVSPQDIVDDEDADNDDDDAVSVPDTMYTKRMRFTGNWIEDHSNSNSYLSQCDNNLYDYDEDLQISTYKEYDLYLLDRLKGQVSLNDLTCFVPECGYSTDTLLHMMVHDYKHHFKHAWFYCQKCGRIFTSKVFLDYHLDRQNGGRFMCYKCGDIFEFQHQLDRHLIRHKKCINYRCSYCNFEFLTESELVQHCISEQHNPNGERKLIRIEPQMTIINEVPNAMAQAASNRREHGHTVSIFIMKLPPTYSKRPMELPGHKPYRRQIGDVEFRNQRHPNCWGWK